jgi:eukaryotic-like serine/threonine-protein kinase
VPADEASADATTSLTGRVVLGRYRIVRPLARGGMGVVYLGRVEGAAGFSKPVVVKSVIATFGKEDDNARLFAREARIVANLQHPGIVGVIDFGNVGNSCVMVLEYVHGYHLGQWLRFVTETRGPMPVEHAVHVILSVLDALGYAHGVSRPDGKSLGIVHRDISPANVLIDQQGHVKLSDFGIARMADDEFKTQEGLFRGTLPYSAPETLHGHSMSAKVDQYGCAVILYHLLAGKNPFKGAEPPETMTRVLTLTPPPISVLRDDVPPQIDAAITRALSKDPDKRFPSVEEFAEAMRSGAEWTERDADESFAAQIERDFAGAVMAEYLGIESLAVRDASWREAQDSPAGRVSLSSSPPGIQSGVRPQSSVPEQVAPVERRTSFAAKASRATTRRLGLWIVFAALAAGAGSAAVIALFPRSAPENVSRLVVIEKQSVDPSAPAPGASVVENPVPAPATAAVAPSTASATAPSAASAAGRVGSSPASENRGALLARAFQKQEGKIQSCFQQHGDGASGTPNISVRFQIDASGAVQNAALSPSSVAGTPVGQCILGVARGTNFGQQPEPISFSIPIAARVVRR